MRERDGAYTLHLCTQSGLQHTKMILMRLSEGATGGVMRTARPLAHCGHVTLLRSRVGSVIMSLGTLASWSLAGRGKGGVWGVWWWWGEGG